MWEKISEQFKKRLEAVISKAKLLDLQEYGLTETEITVFNFKVQVEVINDVDVVLEKLDNVITTDAIILDKCVSWINFSVFTNY